MVLIGDGVMAMVCPKTDAKAWKKGPKWWCDLMEEFVRRPGLTRVVGAAQIAAGVWWALRQERSE
jgi:hypothetical protein